MLFTLVVVVLVGYFSSPCWSSFDLSINGQLVFLSVSILFHFIPNNARLDRSKLEEKRYIVVKLPIAIAGSQVLSRFDLDQLIQLNLAQFSSSSIQLNSVQL